MISNVNIEESVLACIMIDQQLYINKVDENDFTDTFCVAMYKAMKQLADSKKEIDIIQVEEKMKWEGGLQRLAAMTEKIPTTAGIKGYCKTLKDLTARRTLVKLMQSTIKDIAEDKFESVSKLKAEALSKVASVQVEQEDREDCSMLSIMMDVMDDIDKSYKSTSTKVMNYGLRELDKLTAGLHGSEMTIIAARPGIGKTTLALQVAEGLTKQGNEVIFFSREMSKLQLGKRLLSAKSRVNGNKLRVCKSLVDEDFVRLAQAVGTLSESTLLISDKASTIEMIYEYCKDLHDKGKLDAILIDYLGLLNTTKKLESHRVEIESISKRLKAMSLEFDVPIVVLCQLNRENAQQKTEPALHNLRETGSIEQDADNVIFLHIPKGVDEEQDIVEIKLIIAKQRNGPSGSISLMYDKKIFKFYDIRKDHY